VVVVGGRLPVRGVLYLRLGSLFSLWRSIASLRRLMPCMQGGKRWLSQVKDHAEVRNGGGMEGLFFYVGKEQ
jgi:hypothetical protein